MKISTLSQITARVSAAYHSVISTCKFHRISILEYLKKLDFTLRFFASTIQASLLVFGLIETFFKEIVTGNRDYQNLMPATIGIPDNKSCANEYKVN